MPTEAMLATAHLTPWYVALGVGLFLVPILVLTVLKRIGRDRADMSLSDLANAQGGIYKATMADAREVTEQLRIDRDRAEKRNDDLVLKLTAMTDQLVRINLQMQDQTEQIQRQQAQMESQADLLDRQTLQLREQSEKLSQAQLTIDSLRLQINDLEGRLDASSN